MKSKPASSTKKYSLTPEHQALLAPWRDRWIANALNTRGMDDADRLKMRTAIVGMYRAAKLEPPPPERIIFVASPRIAAIAGMIASGVWALRAHPAALQLLLDQARAKRAPSAATRDATWAATRDATRAATEAATRDATRDATEAATWAATRAATEAATWAATRAATWDATRAATWAATRAATWDATEAATWAATRDATEAATWAATRAATWAATEAATWDATEAATWAATRDATEAAARQASLRSAELGPLVTWLLSNLPHWHVLFAGGNEWSAGVDFMSFFRHVAKLDLPVYEDWQWYEDAAIHGGPRMMHKHFCIVSDRAEIIRMDDQNRLHCEDGPAKRWRDGWSLWYWHGIAVPEQVIMRPKEITLAQIDAEQNAEVRRVMIERFGPGRFLAETGAEVLDSDSVPVDALVPRGPHILRALMKSKDGRAWLVASDGSTERVYHMEVERDVRTCQAAHASLLPPGCPQKLLMES